MRFLFLLLILLGSIPVIAQQTFAKSIGTSANEMGIDVVELKNGDFIIAGTREQNGNTDAYLLRVSNSGDIIWDKTFGGSKFDAFEGLLLTSDSLIVAVGSSASYSTHSDQRCAFMVKCDMRGTFIWSKTYTSLTKRAGPELSNESFRRIIELANHNYYIGGQMVQNSTYQGNAFFAITDPAGNIINYVVDDMIDAYHSTLRGSPFQLPNGDLMLGFAVHQAQSGSYFDPALMRLDKNGVHQWSKIYTGESNEDATSLASFSNGDLLLAGGSNFPNSSYNGGYAAFRRVSSSNGDLYWNRQLIIKNGNGSYGAENAMIDGEDIVTSIYDYADGTDPQAYLVKFNRDQVIWAYQYGGSGTDVSRRSMRTKDGGYVMIGYTTSSGQGGQDVYIIKTDANGIVDIPCFQQQVEMSLLELAPNKVDRNTLLTSSNNSDTYLPSQAIPYAITGNIGFDIGTGSTPTNCAAKNGTAWITFKGKTSYPVQWQTTPPITDTLISGLDSGSYQVIVFLPQCTDTFAVHVDLINPSSLGALIYADTCDKGTGEIIVSGANNYQWNTTPPQTGDHISGLYGGQFYSVHATYNNGCELDSTFMMTSVSDLQIEIELGPELKCPEDHTYIIINPTDTGQLKHTYSWQVSPPLLSNRIDDIGPGTYTVQVSSEHGCTKDTSFTIEAAGACGHGLYAANSFTPNGDGNNELFRLDGYGILGIHLRIWDRWGHIIFEGSSPHDGWDGTFKGKLCKSGIYVWQAIILYEDLKEEQMEFGRVNLIR